MRAPDLQELAFVDVAVATHRHFEARNYRAAQRLWVVLLLISLGGLFAGIGIGSPLHWLVSAFNLLALAALPFARKSATFQNNFSTLLLALLSLEIVLWILLPSDGDLALVFTFLFVSLSQLILRLRVAEHAALSVLAIGAAYLRVIASPWTEPADSAMDLGGVLGIAIVTTIAGTIGASMSSRRRQEFTVSWRLAASRERDRVRMRDELHDARAIQLAMLPAAPPEVPGLDLAAVCVPATEVGGDYYGYFPGPDGALGVAIGDVAGHGVASGLVLAGVRAGLHLLADEVATDPAAALARLNTVVGAPGGQRLLMTLGLARFDPGRGRATWVAAGHPPPVRFEAATRIVESPETGHPPLGTKLPLRLETVERTLAAGDVWLLVSDGALEARDGQQREFGEVSLARAFAHLAGRGLGAGAIIDGILAELARFRGGEAQEDDLTLVVVRVPPAS